MNFFETVAGHELAASLTRNLPKIAEAMTKMTNNKRKQHAALKYDHEIDSYLNHEFEQGRVFVSITPIVFPERAGGRVLIITEDQ